ncbi:ATP-binding cassette subfamily B protein/subfamily B ATP-binding cassette protein MsbA [Paenibacillus sp. DS2015]|uniref:ABC transporter ATP-binding protein n=1 Tax=Paenibacillus sp. DS2015 TaxID=3373917 RepID=UPI003D213F92
MKSRVLHIVKANNQNILKGFVLLLFLVFIDASLLIFSIDIQRWIIDDIFVGGDKSLIVPYMLILGFSLVTPPLIFFLTSRLAYKIALDIQRVLTSELLSYIQKLPVLRFQEKRIGKWTHYFTSDINHIKDFYTFNIPELFKQTAIVILLCLYFGWIDKWMFFAILFISIGYVILMSFFGKMAKNAQSDVQKQKADLSVHLEEAISSTREVISFNRLDWEKKRLNSLYENLVRYVLRDNKIKMYSNIITHPLKWGPILLVLLWGGNKVLKSEMTLGTWITLYQFTAILANGIQGMFDMLLEMKKASVYTNRLNEVFKEESINEGNMELNEIKSLSMKNISFSYEGSNSRSQFINNLFINFSIGKKIAITGSSGSGKSTVAKLLSLYCIPHRGEILLNEIPITNYSTCELFSRVSICSQDPYIFPDTIRNNILFGREATEEQLDKVCNLVYLKELIEDLPEGFDTILGERGYSLSGGQRQRLAIARSLLHDSDILILDEATSALDLELERKIQRNLDILRKGKTTIVIAHRLSTIVNSDIIFVMKEGGILEKGSHKELLEKKGEYYHLLQSQEYLQA